MTSQARKIDEQKLGTTVQTNERYQRHFYLLWEHTAAAVKLDSPLPNHTILRGF